MIDGVTGKLFRRAVHGGAHRRPHKRELCSVGISIVVCIELSQSKVCDLDERNSFGQIKASRSFCENEVSGLDVTVDDFVRFGVRQPHRCLAEDP